MPRLEAVEVQPPTWEPLENLRTTGAPPDHPDAGHLVCLISIKPVSLSHREGKQVLSRIERLSGKQPAVNLHGEAAYKNRSFFVVG